MLQLLYSAVKSRLEVLATWEALPEQAQPANITEELINQICRGM